MLQAAAAVTGGSLLTGFLPRGAFARAAAWPQAGAAPADPIAAMRAQMGAAPIVPTKLADNLTLLSGPGGNVVVLNGPDGKIVVDTFVQPAWPKLKQILDGMGSAPVKLLIDTHWHFDHTDNNAAFHAAGTPILAHENTKKRMTETHDLLGMHFTPSPVAALPTKTFRMSDELQANGETLRLAYIPPAHTDSDIYVHYLKANVLHMADVFFNGMYPFIDAGTGGNINGQIAGAAKIMTIADNSTKIVPGHGPLGDKAALTKYHDMLVTIRDRVRKQKAAGKKLEEVTAAKPTAEFDAAWGKGLLTPDQFVGIVYTTV
jgi:glyoxylase-like metal-dependent hydrolase (beta-lactamase superfamily II)